jgi:integrase
MEKVLLANSRCYSTVTFVKERKPAKTWKRTGHRNLLRHKSGSYYARAFAGGKEVWKSLGTSHFSVAQARLGKFLKEHREQSSRAQPGSAKLTFGAALQQHLRKLEDRPNIKPSTVHYWKQIYRALLRSWSGLEFKEIRRVTATECEKWARDFRRTGARANEKSKEPSPTRFNNTLDGLRHVFRLAKDLGIIHGDPSAKIERLKIRQKQLTLPSGMEFAEIVERVASSGAGQARHCSDFTQGLAFTGMRKSEANALEWRDVDFDAGEIVVRGDSSTATKNWELRRVPLIPDALFLFERMRIEQPRASLTSKVFRVRECQRALTRACKKVGTDRITHHDLRHMFATRCIESGVDIPTVSRWLGHKDGGALAMKTYGHLRREHSITQAQRVTFAPTATKQANIVAFPKNS